MEGDIFWNCQALGIPNHTGTIPPLNLRNPVREGLREKERDEAREREEGGGRERGRGGREVFRAPLLPPHENMGPFLFLNFFKSKPIFRYETGVLSQFHAAGGSSEKLHPIAYFSQAMTAPQIKYTVGDKELLAIVEALREFRDYTHNLT